MTSAERQAKWRALNPERAKEHSAKYRAKNRDKRNATERARYQADPEASRRRNQANDLKRKTALAGYAPRVCEICRRSFTTAAPASFDHNHATGKFRGWLCRPCNQALGLFQDLPDNLLAAAEYLRTRGFAAG